MEQQTENTTTTTSGAAPNPVPAAQAPSSGSRPTFIEFVDKYKKIITYALGGIVAVFRAFAAYNYFILRPMEVEAQAAIYKAQTLFEQDSMGAALRGVPPTAPGQEATMGLKEITDQYGSTETGNLAEYYAAVASMHQGQWQEAIDHLKNFNTKSKMFKPLSLGLLGDAHSQLKDYSKAAGYYEKAAKTEDNDFTAPRFYKKAGLAYEESGKNADALKMYEKIKETYPTSEEGSTIEKYIARAKGKALK